MVCSWGEQGKGREEKEGVVRNWQIEREDRKRRKGRVRGR